MYRNVDAVSRNVDAVCSAGIVQTSHTAVFEVWRMFADVANTTWATLVMGAGRGEQMPFSHALIASLGGGGVAPGGVVGGVALKNSPAPVCTSMDAFYKTGQPDTLLASMVQVLTQL